MLPFVRPGVKSKLPFVPLKALLETNSGRRTVCDASLRMHARSG
jgi:hypothetical protein